jgi:uncharacterized protein (TIGR00288 family)
MSVSDGDRSLAIFIDFENLALGFQGRRDRFDIARVLERLVEKGKIVAKKAYADWSRFQQFTHSLHEAAIELVEIPRRGQSGKNSADIRLCVDAMDLAYSKEHIDTFVVLSGDSDFSPLVSKLKELGKHVIGLGMQDSTSDLLRDNCDEFIYYEDLGQDTTLAAPINAQIPETKRKAFALLMESLLALRRENKEVLWSSMIKDTMKRKKPSFNETYHGYRTFSELLEDAQREGLLDLETDKRSRTYVVTRFGSEAKRGEGPPPPSANGGKKKSRRRRRRGGQQVAEGTAAGGAVATPSSQEAAPSAAEARQTAPPEAAELPRERKVPAIARAPEPTAPEAPPEPSAEQPTEVAEPPPAPKAARPRRRTRSDGAKTTRKQPSTARSASRSESASAESGAAPPRSGKGEKTSAKDKEAKSGERSQDRFPDFSAGLD